MSKLQQSERDEFIAKLRETLKPGDTLHTVLRQVSRSGMSRVVDVYHFRCVDGKMEKYWLSYWIAKAIDFSFAKKPEGIKVGGCGMELMMVPDCPKTKASIFDRLQQAGRVA